MRTQRDISNDVVFRVFRNGGDVIALWPAVLTNKHYCQSYQHIGQHGPADYNGLISITRLASPVEYAELLKELRRLGYSPNVIKRITPKHRSM